MKKTSGLTIRVESQLHDKFRYIAEYEGRSMSGQILYLMQKCVREFEKEQGKIILEKDD